MKVGMFAVIPADVRYDRKLSDKSKLLYGEIGAATNMWGLAEEDNNYYATAINADTRTVSRCLTQLEENGYLLRIMDRGRRKFKLILKGIPLPESAGTVVPRGPSEEDIKTYNNILSFWELRRKIEITPKEPLYPTLKDRLKTFSPKELIDALSNRCEFLNQSQWHKDNPDAGNDIMAVFSDDDTTLSWLNAKLI